MKRGRQLITTTINDVKKNRIDMIDIRNVKVELKKKKRNQ